MHHRENNLWNDASSTLRYRRDSPLHFLRYIGRFLTIGLIDLCRYLWRTRRGPLLRQVLLGEAVYFACFAALLQLNARAAVVAWLLPLLIARLLMMTGNWAQHAFIDPHRPESPFGNSVTCINHPYNRRCFNDGYHAAHHLRAAMHWSELPRSFDESRERYAREGALVFSGVDFFGIWALLMLKRYDRLADRLVQLAPQRLTQAEAVALLQSRTAPVLPERSSPGLVTLGA